MISFGLLTGRSEEHLVLRENYKLHKKVLPSFINLQTLAKKNGFDLQIVSAFRSFERQQEIWNNKISGQKILLDTHGRPLEFAKLSSEQILLAALRWSALPGASRHHWGTDFDVYDKNSLPSPDYKIQLTPKEVANSGPMGKFHDWLDEVIKSDKSFGFYRPYQKDLDGVAPERWHLSFAPLALPFLQEYSFDFFLQNIILSEISNKDLVLDHALKIYAEYFINVS